MISLTLPGSIRSKKNSKRIFKQGKMTRVLPSKAYVAWEKDARWSLLDLANSDNTPSEPLRDLLHVKVTAYFKGPQPDLSGVLESVGDCLEDYIWENDKQIVSWDGSRLIHDKDNPRTLVEVGLWDDNE